MEDIMIEDDDHKKFYDLEIRELEPFVSPEGVIEAETKMLTSYNSCDVKNPSIIKQRLSLRDFQLKSEKLENFILNFRDYEDQKKLGCIVDSNIGFNTNGNFNNLKVGKISKIKEDSEKIVFDSGNQGLIYKSQKKTKNLHDIRHEAFVGFFALNYLRKHIPNFPMTYSLTNIAPLSKSSEYYTLTTERVPGVTLKKFLENYGFQLEVKNLSEIILQIESALNLAFKKYYFTHYDLHTDNILIQILKEPIEIPIYFEEKIYYLVTNYLVSIIDFGYSFVKIQGKSFGSITRNLFRFEIYHDRPYPMHDTYKLLCFCFESLLRNSEAKDFLEKLFTFFGTKTLETRTTERFEKFFQKVNDTYNIATNFFIDKNHDDFLNHFFTINNEYRLAFLYENSTGVNNFLNYNILEWQSLLNELYDKEYRISSTEQYRNLISSLERQEDFEIKDKDSEFVKSFEGDFIQILEKTYEFALENKNKNVRGEYISEIYNNQEEYLYFLDKYFPEEKAEEYKILQKELMDWYVQKMKSSRFN